MTTELLKDYFLEEHRRDKKLTIISFLLQVGMFCVVVLLLFKFSSVLVNQAIGSVISKETLEAISFNEYYRIIIPVIMIGYLIYLITSVNKIKNRPILIETFIDKLNNGLIAGTIHQSRIYKIRIPLVKLTINLYPVECLAISLVNDTNLRGYTFPIPEYAISDAKILLSGTNKNRLNNAWYELYDITYDEGVKEEEMELKTVEEFTVFLENNLLDNLEEIEGVRKLGKNNLIVYSIVSGAILIGFMLFQYLQRTNILTLSPQLMGVGLVVFFAVLYLCIYFFKIKNKTITVQADMGHLFKNKMFEPMIKFINPSFVYVLHGHLSISEFIETGIFQDKHYDITGDDQVIGKHKGVPFQFCDMVVNRIRNFSIENRAPDQVFSGQMFIAKFNKSFKSDVYLIPKKNESLLKGNDIKDHLSFDHGEKIVLEDPEFMKIYDVYGTDQIEARYILSLGLISRLKDLTKRCNGACFISFRNDRISIANNSGENNFETSYFKSLTKNDLVIDFYKDICDQLSIIDELKLNINIWKK